MISMHCPLALTLHEPLRWWATEISRAGKWDKLLYAGGKDTLARTVFDR